MAKKIVKPKRKINYTGYFKKACAIAGIGLVGGLAGMSGGALMDKPVVIDKDALATSVVDKINANQPVDDTATHDALVVEMHDKIFEEDAWEAEAEIVASDEWEERDYKDVFNAIDDLYGDIDDRDEIVYVKVKDTDFRCMDADDKDGIVTQELKVRYDNMDNDHVNRYITVTTTLEDGEIEDQEFSETH